MDKKKQIEELYTEALYNDEAPNVFADRILSLFGVSKSFVCGCNKPDISWYGTDDNKQYFCFSCREEAN